MATTQYRGNATNPGGAGGGPLIEVITPVRSAAGSGAGGGRVLGTLISVGAPTIQPKPGGLPSPPTGLFTPLGNPNFPCAAGPQIQALTSTTVPVDTGTGYYFRHIRNPEASGNNNLRFTTEFAPAADLQQHMLAFDYYGAATTPNGIDNATAYVEPTRYVLQVNAVTLGGAAAVVWDPRFGGSAGTVTAAQAVQQVGGNCLRLDSNTPATGYFDVTFDPAQLAALLYVNSTGPTFTEGSRIVKLTLRYRAWRDSSADPTPSEGFSVYYYDNTYPGGGGTFSLYLASWLVTQYQNNAPTVAKSLGEVNYAARGYATEHLSNGAAETWHAHPYTIEDLVTFMGSNQVGFRVFPVAGLNSGQRYLYMDYLELDVDVIPERRVGAAIRVVSNVYNNPQATGAGSPQTYDSSYQRFSKSKWPPSSLFLADLTGNVNNYFDLCIREALPIDPSDLLRVQPNLGLASLFEAIGPSLQIPAITQYQQTQDPQLQTFTATIINGQDKARVLTPFETYNLSAAAFFPDVATSGSFWAGYRGMAIQNRLEVWGAVALSTYGNAQLQRVWVNGGTTYTYVHLIAQASQFTTAPLFIDVLDASTFALLSTSFVNAATVNLLQDRGGGWKSFTVNLQVPYTPAVSGYAFIVAYSSTQEINTWLLSGAESVGQQPQFGYDVLGNSLTNYPSPTTYPAASAAYDNMVDHAMYLACALATPTAPTVTVQSAFLFQPACDATSVQWAQVTWTPDASVDKYAVEFTIDGGATWVRRAIVETFGSVAPQTYNDYGSPWDIPTYYRLVSYRMLDRSVFYGPASTPVTCSSIGVVFGFSTATQAFVYSPVDNSQVVLNWTDLNSVTNIQLHGEGLQRALREQQDRGLSLTCNVLITDIGSCTPGTIVTAASALSETPFEQIRGLRAQNKVVVRFPGGPTRFMSLELGGLIVTTASGVYQAQIKLTDVSPAAFGNLTFTADEFSPVSDI